MEHPTFFEHYRVSRSDDESAQEVSRTGAAINYKAIDTRSHEPVQLQLIPVATIEPSKLQQLKERAQTAEKLDHVNIAKTLAVGVEHDYLALVSEHFEGETVDSWIVANGPMPADAALRVGLQVVLQSDPSRNSALESHDRAGRIARRRLAVREGVEFRSRRARAAFGQLRSTRASAFDLATVRESGATSEWRN